LPGKRFFTTITDMKTHPRIVFSSVLWLLVFGLSTAAAQNINGIYPILSDPGIPDGEEIRYQTTSGDDVSYSLLRVSLGTSEVGEVFLVENRDDEIRRVVTVRRDGLIPLESSSLSQVNRSAYESSTRLLQAPATGEDEVFVLSVEDISFLLRGYPFDSPRRLTLHLLGQSGEDGGFSLDVVYRREESLDVLGREYQAHKLELVTSLPGAMAIFRGAIPKTFLWFNAEAPHQLLRYEGSAGFGSGDELVTEMVSYRRVSNSP
jgi:hypothetical protein